MHLGYFMMPLHQPGARLADTLQADLDQLVRVEELGYAEAWIGEHFTAEWENVPAPDLLIAAALARTSRIRLGTGVACLPNHSPFVLAHRIAQLDQMARGRFMFGVGSGGFPGDFAVFGVDPKSGVQRELTRDAIDLILALWADPTPGLYAQHTWRFSIPTPDPEIAQHVHVRPYTQPHPPIAVAGVSERSETLTLAGERGWIPMSINLVPERILTGHWATMDEAARAAGRHADRVQWRIARDIHVAPTTKQARQEALSGALGRDYREYFLPLVKRTGMIRLMKQDPAMSDDDVTLEYLMENVWIVGDPDSCAEQIQALNRATGGFGVLLAIAHDWPDPSVWDRSMRLLATEVLPQLDDLELAVPGAGSRSTP